MTRLLVSVRNPAEALAALAGGADLIDIKEPARGALGAADETTWQAVQGAVAGRAPVSAALGELLALARAPHPSALQGLTFVKAGLAGAAGADAWRHRLRSLHETLPSATQLVAVAYADHQAAQAPTPWQVLDAARELRLPALLIDTFDKRRGDLWSALGDDELRELLGAAHQCGLAVALAGSLTLAAAPRAQRLSPEWLAVRGAACSAGRTGEVDAARVRALKQAIAPAAMKQ